MVKDIKVPCSLWRGGTSKGAFFKREDLPSDEKSRNEIFLSIIGSPDPMQIDGLGGARSSTSKIMIVSPSERPGIDIEYTFGAVGIDKPTIGYQGNCGNLTAAVAPFAIDEGLISPKEEVTKIKMYNTNTSKVIIADVPISEGKFRTHGDYSIDGVPGTGARMDFHFIDPGGAGTGSLLPTGNLIDIMDIGDERITCSIIDVTNPVVFVRAGDLDFCGTELPENINSDEKLLSRLERIRSVAAEVIGFVKDRKDATWVTPSVPLIAYVAAPSSYTTISDKIINRRDINLIGRVISMQKMHHAFALSAAICTAAAAKLKGTVVNEVFDDRGGDTVVIGHPKGTIAPIVKTDQQKIQEVIIARTARLLMKGEAYAQYAGKAAHRG